MTAEQIRPVVDTWVEQYEELGAMPRIGYVQIFENRGEMMGCSNAHPHGQIWASREVPHEIVKEDRAQEAYSRERGSCLLCDYLALERQSGERLVCENELFTAVVPFWAVWPFEAMVLTRRHVGSLPDLTDPERDALAETIVIEVDEPRVIYRDKLARKR